MFSSEKKQEIFNQVIELVKKNKLKKDKVTKKEVFQKAVNDNRELARNLCRAYMKDGSDIVGIENFIELYELSQSGKACLITSEHKSNLDVPNLYTLMYDKYEKYLDMFETIVFIAGRKLNEETPGVKIFAEMFNRMVIVPKNTKVQTEEEKKEMFAINRSAQKWMREYKYKGYIFLIFPTGTRTRDWEPETARGIREAYNYLKNFDYFTTLSIEGNTMPVSKNSKNMLEDPCINDKIVYTFGEVKSTKEYIEEKLKCTNNDIPDIKQHVVDNLMEDIYSVHRKNGKGLKV